jgi:hypothetical protein
MSDLEHEEWLRDEEERKAAESSAHSGLKKQPLPQSDAGAPAKESEEGKEEVEKKNEEEAREEAQEREAQDQADNDV